MATGLAVIFALLALAVGPSIGPDPGPGGDLTGGLGTAANLAGSTARHGAAGPAGTGGASAAGTKAHAPASRKAPSAGKASPAASIAPSGTPKRIASALLGHYGWPASQFGCLDSLWIMESGWNPYATNPSSGAYGIPQSLPAYKMATAGADWRTNPLTQIRWGLSYIKGRYGTPCGAWAHETAYRWY